MNNLSGLATISYSYPLPLNHSFTCRVVKKPAADTAYYYSCNRGRMRRRVQQLFDNAFCRGFQPWIIYLVLKCAFLYPVTEASMPSCLLYYAFSHFQNLNHSQLSSQVNSRIFLAELGISIFFIPLV